MVEEMYLEEEKEQQRNTTTLEGGGGGNNINHEDENLNNVLQNQSPTQPHEDQKPRLVRIDSECVSSIINNNHDHNKNEANKNLNHHHQLAADAFGSVDIDFSSYNTHHSSDHMVAAYTSNEGFHHGGGGGGVSLTLGLQQHGGNGVSLAFPSTSQGPMFYTREQIDEPVQYSLLDGEGTNIMPYRNLMGTQLLHDLA